MKQKGVGGWKDTACSISQTLLTGGFKVICANPQCREQFCRLQCCFIFFISFHLQLQTSLTIHIPTTCSFTWEKMNKMITTTAPPVMRMLCMIIIIMVSSSSPAAALAPAPTCPPWNYDQTSPYGPLHWGELCDDYRACRDGLAQSPVDLVDPDILQVDGKITNLQYHYETLNNFTLINIRDTIEVYPTVSFTTLYTFL